MRVLFTVTRYSAHYFPLVPTAWALRAAGHEVVVACPPCEVALVGRAGLAAVPIEDGHDPMYLGRLHQYFQARQGQALLSGGVLHPVTGQPMRDLTEFDWARYKAEHRDANVARLRAGLDTTVAFARDWRPDLVVHDPLNMTGVLVGQVLGIPAWCHLWGPVGPLEERVGTQLVPRDHTDSFARHGVPPMGPELIERIIDPCPPVIGSGTALPTLPVRCVPYNGSGTVPELPPRGGRPRICVAWGNSLDLLLGPGSFLVPDILRALAPLPVEVVVVCGSAGRDRLGPLPGNVHVLSDLPLRLLLPYCEAIVYHGGAGSGMTAAWAGVPQLALPFTAEQQLTAERITRAGSGVWHVGYEVGTTGIRDAVSLLLDEPRYQHNAAALREEIAAMPSPAQVVEDLVARPRCHEGAV
ncbi:DUF1205 domain-containing protein [Kutzneria viridogrisea]